MYYLKGLPRSRELAEMITRYVKKHKDYNLAQIGNIIDGFYNRSCGLSIAEEIKCIWM